MKRALWLQIILYNSHNTAFIYLEKYCNITISYFHAYVTHKLFLHKYKLG